MLSELQRKDVWEGWIGGEISANYFADRCSYFQTEQKLLTLMTLLFSSGAAVTFITDWLPLWVKPVLMLLTAAISLYLLLQQSQKRVTECADLHFRWNRLAGEYKALWDDILSRRLGEASVARRKGGGTLPEQHSNSEQRARYAQVARLRYQSAQVNLRRMSRTQDANKSWPPLRKPLPPPPPPPPPPTPPPQQPKK